MSLTCSNIMLKRQMCLLCHCILKIDHMPKCVPFVASICNLVSLINCFSFRPLMVVRILLVLLTLFSGFLLFFSTFLFLELRPACIHIHWFEVYKLLLAMKNLKQLLVPALPGSCNVQPS